MVDKERAEILTVTHGIFWRCRFLHFHQKTNTAINYLTRLMRSNGRTMHYHVMIDVAEDEVINQWLLRMRRKISKMLMLCAYLQHLTAKYSRR